MGYGSRTARFVIKKMETDAEIKGKAYVHRKAWQETYTGLIDRRYLDAMTLEKYERLAYRWRENVLIAKEGERVIGFCSYGKCRDDDLPDAGEITAIYVLAAYHGTGAGRVLMEAGLGELDYPRTAVWVLRENGRAVRIYEKLGFRFDGSEKEITLGTPVTERRMILQR